MTAAGSSSKHEPEVVAMNRRDFLQRLGVGLAALAMGKLAVPKSNVVTGTDDGVEMTPVVEMTPEDLRRAREIMGQYAKPPNKIWWFVDGEWRYTKVGRP